MGKDLPEPSPGIELPLLFLEELADVGAHSCSRNMLERLTTLKVLKVRIESSPEDEPLSFFGHLDILDDLREFECVVMYPDIGSLIAPSSIPAFPSTLRQLTLSGCGFPWEYMRVIAALPKLYVLKLQTCAFQGPQWEVKRDEFPKLLYLLLEDMDIENWKFVSSTGSCFRNLKCLIIRHCYKLRNILSIFADSLALKMLEVVDCSTSAMNSAVEIKEKMLNQENCSTDFDIYSSRYDD